MMGACRKIVRLILMSNISRRKFLKGAGVAALAVAAAGVLAGCSANDVIDKVATETLDVILYDTEKNAIVEVPSKVTVEAKKGDKVGTKDIKLPDGYIFTEENPDLEIDWDKKQVTVKVYETQNVVFKLIDADSGEQVGDDVKAVIAKSRDSFEIEELPNFIKVPDGYELLHVKPTFQSGVVEVGVCKKP